MKFQLAREGNFIRLQEGFWTFPLEAAKQATVVMTARSATVLKQKYSSSVSLWVLRKGLAFTLLWSSVHMLLCVLIWMLLHREIGSSCFLKARLLLLSMKLLWEGWYYSLERCLCSAAPSYWQLDHNISNQKQDREGMGTWIFRSPCPWRLSPHWLLFFLFCRTPTPDC